MINGFIDVISIGNNNNNNSLMYAQEEQKKFLIRSLILDYSKRYQRNTYIQKKRRNDDCSELTYMSLFF